jgi:hypothetical protein
VHPYQNRSVLTELMVHTMAPTLNAFTGGGVHPHLISSASAPSPNRRLVRDVTLTSGPVDD